MMTWPDTATLLTYGDDTTDAEGNVVEATPTTADYEAWLQQTESVEVNDGRRVVTSRHVLFVKDPTAPITAASRVTVDGTTFEVLGRPDTVKTPRGPHHIEARVAVVES